MQAHQVTPIYSYRAYYRPAQLIAENGVLPFIQVRARNAEAAQRAAHHLTGHPIDSVERIVAQA